ncbi:uncharacterized protein LOC142642856 isoform X2 [Castanea sativa]|uniref:uncharacterized protein LOC142642856 isoform X2 n=1 Tax=Castanea sativa TaxID=21020 RepID=UPI003F64C188
METGPDISEAISYNGRICQADEITRQPEMVISDDEKQLQKGEKIEAVEEAGIEITEVEEINKRAISGNKNHDTANVTGSSSQIAKAEEENLNIEGHETLKDERVYDQHVEVISNQQASIEEIPQSTEKETKDAQKEEERETVVDKDTLVESSEEVISILEETAVQTSKASVHTKDLTVNNLNNDVETVTDLCTKDETIDKSSTADTTLFQEGLGETNLKGVEYKETEKYSDLVAEEKGPETIRPSEEIGKKDEKDKVMYDRIEDAFFSTKEESPNIQNDEGTTLDIGDGDKDKPEKSSVILEQCRASQQEDGPEVGEKIKDACSTECEEKKQDATELNKQEKDVISVEDEMQNKNRLDTPFVTEETSQQEVDNSEIFKVDPKIGLENIVMESTKEVTNPNEIFEKFSQADSSASENSKDVENYDKKLDASSGTCEDGMQSKAEDLDVTEASAGETREKEGFTVMVNEDNISKTDFIEAMKLSKLESKEHVGGPEHNLLQQNEPEKEELERPSNKISEEIETGASRENTRFENPEDSFKVKKHDKSTATYDTTSVDIPGQKNPPLIDSNEKTESSEAEIQNNNANNLHVTHSLVEETGQVQGKRIDEVFEFEPEEEIQKSTCTSTDEENQVANASEAYKSTEGTIIEHSSAEGTVRMETNITEKLETVYGLESDEKLEVSDAQANKPEVTPKEEAIVTGNDIEEGSLENDRTKVDHSVYTGDKTAEQSLPVRSLTEPAPTLSGEDERSNIILEEVHDGHKIPVPGSGDVNNEQIFEANDTFFTSKPIEKETTKKYQDSEKETREEDGSLEIMKEGQVKELSPESIGKGPIQDFKEDEKEAYKDEILEKSQPARAGESIAHETNHDESPEEILHVSLAKQEEGLQGEVEHLVSTEASAENGDKGTSSVKVTEDNNDNNNIGLAEATGNSAKVTPQGEEDSEEGLQIDETASIVVESPENIIIASSVKQKEDLQEEGEKLDSTEASIKNNDEEIFSIKMAEDNDENNKPAETTETSVKVTPKGEEDSEHALQHDEPRETKLEFESPGEVLDTSLVGESTNLALAETSQQKREEGISSVKVVVDNNRLAETTENSAKATPEGEEDSDQMLQKDEPGEGITRETNNGAEIPENIPDPTLVTQEEGLQGESENLAPTEAAIEKRDGDTSYIKVTEDNDDNEQVEGTENSEKVMPKGGEDSEKILQIDEPGQSIVGMGNHNVDSPEGEEDSEHALQHDEPRETNHEFKSPGEVLDTSLVRKGLQGESTNLAPAETSQEKRDEGTSSAKIVVDNDKLVETTENSAKATPENEEDSDQILQKDEPAEGITHETNNGAKIPENISDPTLMKQEEGLQGESKNLAPRTKAAIEKREEESYIKVTEDNENNEQAEVTENSEKVTPEGGEDSEKILQIDEPGQSLVGTENRNVESPEGEEDSEQALQHDEPQETNHEFESPREILDTSLVNPRKGLQGESTNLAQVETSQEKRDEAITSVKVAVDNDDNDKLAEATENSAKATPEAEVNSEIFLQKYEPGEGITHETDNGAEIPETISDPPLVKQEEGLQGEFENQAPTEAAIEKRDEDTSSINVVEDNDDNGQAEATENSEKVTPEGGEDSEKILQIDEPGQNIVGMENQNVASPENNLDTFFVKQEEVLQGGYNSALTKTSIENSDEDTFFVKVAENNDENNRLAETMEDSVKVTPKGEENSEHVLQKDDPQEKYHNVESPDNIFDNSLLNLEEDLHVDGEDLAPTEASIENKDEDSSLVKVAEHKDGNNRQDDARINNADGTPKGEEDSEHVLQKDAVDESIACETDHEVEKHEKALNTPLAKQEECLQGQDENMIPTEASIEKREGEMSSMKIPEGNDGINRVAEAEGNSVKETAKGEEELEPIFQRDANEKLEQVLDVTPEEMEAESSGENMKKTTCMKEEGIIQNLEETSETEKREETETIDDKKEKEAAREKTFDATTSIHKGNRELILEEIDSVKDQSPEFNEKETTEENSKDQQECRGLGITASSIEEEKPNLEEPRIAELSSSSVGEVIVKELKEEVKGPNLEFIEQIGAKDLTEESKSGTLQDSEEPNKNFSTLIIAETSSFVPDIFEKMIKEQILKQEEHTNIDFDSASVITFSEETGSKEAKPENNEQVKSSDIATEGPATTETDRSNLVNVDINVQPEKISSLEENRNNGILTIAEGGGEKNEYQMEDKAPTAGIGHEVEVTTAEKPLDSVSEDSFQDSYMTPLKDHEPMIIELSRMVEETLARDETTYANAKTPSRVKETNENLTQKEDESIKSKDVSELFSSDDGKEGVNEEVQKHKDAESHMLPKIQNEKNSYDAEDVDISKRGETSDSADQTEVFYTTSVSKGNREHILEETDIVKDQSPAFNEKETTEENSKDDQESSRFETTASRIETEQPNLEEPNITELSSLSVGEVTVKENLKEDESDAMKLKEEVKSPDLEFIEQIGVKDLTEESKSGTLQDSPEPDKVFITLTSAGNSSFVPEVSEKETKEEILKQEEHTNNDFDSASVTVLCEETGLKEAKPENYEQVKSSETAPQGKGPATIETEETNLDNVDIDVQPEEISGLEENRNKEILTVADGGGEKIEHQMEKEEPPRGVGHEVEVTATEKPIDSISEDSSRDSYVMPLKDHEPITIVVSKTVEETPEKDVIADVNAKTPSSVQETDEKLIQKEDEPIKSKDVSELFSSDDGKEDANEKVQKLKDAESQMPPELHSEKNSYDTEDLEISQKGESSDLADQTEVSKLDTFTHENLSNEASKDIAISTCKDSEKATLEQEDSVQNLEGSLKGDVDVVEKGTAELNAGAHSHECEPTNTQDNDQIAEKNLESADLGQKPDFVSESTNKDQTDDTLPQTNKSQTEENKDDVQERNPESVEQKNIVQIEGETERKMEMEPKLEAEDHIHESQKAKDTITAVSTTEKVHDGVEKVNGSENIREHEIDGGSDVKEIHTVSTRDEIAEKEKDSGPASTEYLKTIDSEEHTETTNTKIEEDPTGETETPVTKAPEEEKIPDKSGLEPADVHKGVEDVDESESTREQAIERERNLKEIHTILAKDEILEKEKDYCLESTECLKASYSKEQTETVNTNIEDPTGETKVLITEAPKEVKIPNEDGLEPVEEHEGVEKVSESENIIEQAEDRNSNLKETHAIFARDEILEEVKDCGPDSIEYVKTTDSKEQIETVNTDIEKDPIWESEAPVTKAPEEEKIQDEGILKPTDEREGFDKTDERENIREEATDGDTGLKEIHTVSAGQEIVENAEDSGPKSIEYLKATDSKEQTKTVNMNIEKVTTGEIEVLVTRTPEEDSLKPVEVHEEVEKVNESKNIIEQAIDGESGLEEIHTRSVGDEILEKMNNFGPESSEYLKATDSKEHIGTANTNIEEYLTREIEVPFTKALEDEETRDEGTLKQADVHEGVEKVDESDNIIQQATDGESDTKEIHTISIEDEKLENVKDSSPESIEYFKETDSKEHIETENKGIKEGPTGETEVSVTKAKKVENLLDEGSLKPVEVHEGVEKATESENIIEQPIDEVSSLKEIHTTSIGDEILEKVKDSSSESIEYLKEIDSKEHIETENKSIKEDSTGETEVPVTKAPKEETLLDEGSLKPVEVHEGVEKATESENIIEQPVDGVSNLKEIHTSSIGDEILEKVNNTGPESIEYLKETDSKEQIGTTNTNIEEYPTGETEAPFTKAPEEEEMKDEGTLKPADVHEGVEKVDESDNIRQATDGESNIKKIHTISIGDEKLESVKDFGSESIEYFKEIDSKEHIETENKSIKEEPTGETEVPVTKAPKEETLLDEGSLTPLEVHEGVEKATESENIIEQPVDGVSNLKEIHTSIGDEMLEKVNNSGPESTEYLKATDSKEQIGTVNTNIEEYPTGETEAPFTKAPEEEEMKDEGTLKPADVREQVEKVDESDNIRQATDGEIDIKKIHTISIGDEKLENVKDSGLESIEYFKEIDSKEHIETENKSIKEDPTRETEVLVTKAPKEETLLDERSLKPIDVHEGVQKATESENIIEQPVDGVGNLKEIYTSIGDEMLEKVNNSGPESTEYHKATNSKEQIGTANTNIVEYPTRETEAPFTKALEEEEMKDEGTLKPADVHEGVEKVDESDNIGQAEKLDKVKDFGSESIEYFKEIDSKGHIETENKSIKEEPTGETEVPVTKAPKEETLLDEGSLTPLEVHEGVEKATESENIIEQPVDGVSNLKEIHTSIGDEMLEKVNNSGPESTEYLKATDSKEQIGIANTNIEEYPTGETEAPFTKALEEEEMKDEGTLKLAYVHEGVEKVDESDNIGQATDGESDMKKIHTISIGDEKLDNVKDFGSESIEYFKEIDSKEHIETENKGIKEDPTGETEVPLTKAPKEETLLDEGSLTPLEVHEGVQKATESENIIEQPVDGVSNLKEIHTTSIGDEMLEKVNNSGPKSTEYLKATDSKEQIRTSNTNIEEYPTRETEAPFTKAPEEEEMKDEGTLKPANVREGVQKVDESDNIKQATDGESDIKIHTISIGDEKLENLKDSGSKSIEYFKEIDSKEHIEIENKGIKEDPTGETEVPVTNATKEENIPDEGSLKLIEVHEGVEKATESENIIEQPVDGVSNLKEIHTISIGDEILEKVNDSGLESIEYLKETNSKEQIETLNTDIEKVSLEETEAPVIKAPEEQKIQDEGSLMTADVHEGVEQVAESENIIQQNKDGEKNMEEIHTGSTRDEIFENVKESGPKSTEYLKETNSKEQTKAVNMDIGEDTTGEAEGLVNIAEVHEEVEKVNESKNTIEQVKNGESSLKEIRTRSTGDEILEKMNDSGPDSTEYPNATGSKEQIITVNKNIEDPTGETEALVTKAPEEEEMQDEGILKPADVHEGFEKVDESVCIRQQAIEGESDLLKIHTISTGDKILENVKGSGSESSEYIKATDSMEHTETKNMDIKEDPTWEAEVPFIKEPKEENIPDEGSLNPTEAHEEVKKIHESENNIEQPVDGASNLKEIYTKKSIGDEILEKVKKFGPESIEYLKETDSKEHIETLNTNFEKNSSSEPESFVTKVPAEEKIQDEGSLNTADMHEGVEQVDESENIIQQNPDGEHYSQEIHTGSTDDEILKNVENSGPKSTDIKEDTREIEASLTKEPKEEKIQDEGSLNPTDGHGGVEKVDRSENIREHAIAGESNLKEIHTKFVGDEMLEKVKDSDLKSTEYHRATDSKEQIETVNTDIEEDPIQEMEAPITKAPEEEKIQDEDSFKPANVHEGVEKANGSENIEEQAIDGESNLKEIYTISVGDGIIEKDKDFGPESIKYLKETKSERKIATIKTNIEEDPIGETKAIVTKAQEEEKIQDEGSLKAVDGHEGVEKADGSANNREQVIDGESDFKEIHKVSLRDDTLNKVKYCSPESTVYLKATDSEEDIETVNTTIKEDPIEETEVAATRALEEEEEKIQDEGRVKPTNVSMTVAEDEEEKIKEDIKVEVDNFPENANNAIVIPAESSLGEAQMDDKPVMDTSSDESLKTIDAEPCPHAEEVGSMTPEKTSFSLVSQLPNMKHNNIETETVTPEKPDADEETKTVSDAVFQSKYHGVEETNETGQSLRVENFDADRTEEGIKEASGSVLESKSLGTEAVIIDEITADQNLPAGKSEEQLQTPSSESVSWEQEHGPTTIVKETEAIKTKEGEILDNKNISDSSATKATEETCLQKEEQPETLSSTFLSTEQEHRTTTTFKKTAEENIKEVEMLDEKGINNFSAIKAAEEACLEQEEPKEFAVSKLGLLDGASKLETADKEECEKIKELTSPIEDASNLSFETSEKALETMLDVHSREALINSEEEIQDKGIVKPEGVSITVAKDSFEYIKEEIKVDNICDKTENATAEVVTAEPSSVEAQLNDKSTEDTISDDRVETSIRESNPPAEEVASMKLEKTSSNLPSQLLNVATKNEEKESETLKNPDANEVEETKTASDAVFESKYEGIKETGETGESLKVEKLDAADIEEMKETSEIPSKSKALGLVEVSEDEVIADHCVSEVQSHEVLTKSEDINEKHLQTAIPHLNTEESESQCKKTVEANKILKNKVFIEEGTEEQEFTKDDKSVTLGEETIIESHQGYESRSEEYPAEETNRTYEATTDAHQHEALRLSEIIDEGNVSEDIAKTIQVEDRTVENENAAESYLDKIQGKTVKEAAMKLDLENQSDDTNFTKATTEVMTLEEKEAGIEILQKEGTLGIAEVKEITQNIQQLETTSYAASETKIPGEECPSENTETIITTAHEDVQPVLQHPIDKALEKVEQKDTRPGKSTEADAEVREVECEGEKRIGDLGEILSEKSTSEDSAKISLSNLMHRSKKENLQVTKDLTKEREPVPSKEEMQNQEAETTVDETKTDEEEGDEHKRTDPGYDAPVMVEAAKDIDVKVVHKKHNILSGVGSKVKHSLSKVKKAITGKSSHPKTTSPK